METLTFKSDIGGVFCWLLVFISIITIVVAVFMFDFAGVLTAAIVLIVFIAIILLWILSALSTKYVFGPETIEIRNPLQFDVQPIRYTDVKTVKDTVVGISTLSHRYSTNALEIRYGVNGYVCISPKLKTDVLHS